MDIREAKVTRQPLAKADDGSYGAPCGPACRVHVWDGRPTDATKLAMYPWNQFGYHGTEGEKGYVGKLEPHVHHAEGCRLERVTQLELVLQRAHDSMDAANGVYASEGQLCIFCNADEYNGEEGVIHWPGCRILEVRAALKQADAGAKGVTG